MIMVRSVSLGWARTAVTGLAEVIRHCRADALSATDRSCRGRNVEDSPVAEGAARGVGIVDHQREALGAGRRITPVKRGCCARAITSELSRHRLAVFEGVAGQADPCDRGVFHG